MKRILITGANRGVGLELAIQYVARGDQVFAGCRSPENAAALDELSTNHPGQVVILPLDVTNEQSIIQCATKVATEVDGLDILINNAAVHGGDEHLSEVKAEILLRVLHVNAVSAVLVAQAFIQLLKKGNHPKLINVSSEAGSIERMGHFRGYNYYGSKAALNMYTRSLAWEPEIEGVTVIAIHPGWVRTDMGGPAAHLSTTESAQGLRKVIDSLTTEDNGKFFTWEGNEYPW